MVDVNENDLQILPKNVFGHNLSMYPIALEGWRRGLTLTFFVGVQEGMFDIQFSLKDTNKVYQFTISKNDKVNDKEIDYFKDKLMKKNNIQKNEENLDIPNAIMDHYFPETINSQKSILHFDFDRVFEVLRKGLLAEVTIAEACRTEMITKCYYAYGDVNKIQFNNWLQQHALNLNLSGHVETLNTLVRLILIYGQKDYVEKFTGLLHKNVPLLPNSPEMKVSVNRKQGFEIIS